MEVPLELRGRKFEFEKVIKLQEVIKAELYEFKGSMLLPQISEEIVGTLGRYKIGDGELVDLLSPWVNKVLEEADVDDIAWKMAGGMPVLKKGKSLSNEFAPGLDWYGAIIWDIGPGGMSKKGSAMLSVELRLIEGPYAGVRIRDRLPYKYVKNVLAVLLGCPIFKPKKVLDIVLFRCVVQIAFSSWPKMKDFYCPGGALANNRRLFKIRQKTCINNWMNVTCSSCSKGFLGASSCPFGVHPRTFVSKFCDRCKQSSLFDPGSNSPYCVTCGFSDVKQGARREHVASQDGDR